MSNAGGYQKLTASGVVGVSGVAVRVYGFEQSSLASGPGVVTMYDGASTAGTEVFKTGGVANSSSQISFGGKGKYFPTGCYLKLDADVSYVTVDYVQASTI